MATWTHLVRFIAEEDGQTHLGQINPQEHPDVGQSALKGTKISAKLVTGSVFDGRVTEKTLTVSRVRLSYQACHAPQPGCRLTTK